MGVEESSVSMELNRIEEQKRRMYSIAFICAVLIFMLKKQEHWLRLEPHNEERRFSHSKKQALHDNPQIERD